MSQWNDPDLIDLFSARTPTIDVRAPVEYADGKIPFSINLPIINNEERAQIGTCYKVHGQTAAIELGHKLVNGEVKSKRLDDWEKFIRENPQAEVFCFRGGLRSQMTCQWLAERGINRNPIPGGYKRLRNFFLSWINDAPLPNWIRIAGPTGSGKSEFIKLFSHVDLECLANHRGSAFGSLGSQPSQITFENELALRLMEHQGRKHLVEDESATIGKITLPKRLYLHLRHSPLVVLKVPLDQRIQNIFELYVKDSSQDFFQEGLVRISRALGGVNYEKIRSSIENAFSQDMSLAAHEEWIGLLLEHYYDPIYSRGLNKQPGKILFQGDWQESKEFIKQTL